MSGTMLILLEGGGSSRSGVSRGFEKGSQTLVLGLWLVGTWYLVILMVSMLWVCSLGALEPEMREKG